MVKFEIPLNYSKLRKYSTLIEAQAQFMTRSNQLIDNVNFTIETNHKDLAELSTFMSDYNTLIEKYGLSDNYNDLLFFSSQLLRIEQELFDSNNEFEQARESFRCLVTLLQIEEQCKPKDIQIEISGRGLKSTISGSLIIKKIKPVIIRELKSIYGNSNFNHELATLVNSEELTYFKALAIFNNNKPTKRKAYNATILAHRLSKKAALLSWNLL